MPDIAQKFLKNRKEHDKIAKEWTRTNPLSPSVFLLEPHSLLCSLIERYATPVVKKPAASSSKESDREKNDKKSKKEVEVLVLD